MLKIDEQRGGEWVELDCPPTFECETLADGTRRLEVGLPKIATRTFRLLAEIMAEPFFVLYVLHTPRDEGEPGRYQSEEISKAQLVTFMETFEGYFAGDARHDLWARSISDGDMIIWDRHNRIFAYGDLPKFAQRLGDLGFENNPPPTLGNHRHHYRPEFDNAAADVLSAFDWHRTPLRPADEQ